MVCIDFSWKQPAKNQFEAPVREDSSWWLRLFSLTLCRGSRRLFHPLRIEGEKNLKIFLSFGNILWLARYSTYKASFIAAGGICIRSCGGLVIFAKKVKTEEFESAALPHFDDLYRTAIRVVGDRTEAEDLVQEAYLQAWKSFHRFEMGTNCRAWLFKILFHVIHHHRRKWFSSKLVKESDELLENVLTYEPPVPENLTDEDILAALTKVPQDFREVLLLADVQEFSYKEVAETLQIPLGTVMSRLSRGRKLLRSEVANVAQSMGLLKTREAGQGQ